MSAKTVCDGCGVVLAGGPYGGAVIHGERADGIRGAAPLPDEDFDWCRTCALVAFGAVRDAARAVRPNRGGESL